MEEQKDYIFEDLIQSTEKTLEDIGKFEDSVHEENGEFSRIYTQNNIARFIADKEEGVDFQLDGHVEIRISNDKITAEADFFPPSKNKDPIHYEKVKSKLDILRIKYGIDNDLIRNSIYECNTENKVLKDVIIARGKDPSKEILKHIVIEQDLFKTEKKILEEDLSVDFKEYTGYKIVQHEQILAKIIPLKSGEKGIDIYGNEIDFKRERIKQHSPGKNIKFINDTIVADCEGIFKYNNNSFWVEKILQVSGDVDYHTGNIDFSGDVIIEGNIRDSFKINSKGSIYCNQTLDASEVYCSNDLNVKKGIIGRKEGIVKVGGGVSAKFIEHCYLEAVNSIFLEIGTLNSYVYTNDKLLLSHKGLIVGGTVYATNGIITTQMGTSSGPKTEIYCGTDHNIVKKMEWVKDKTIELAKALQNVRNKLSKKSIGPEQKAILETYQEKIQGSIHKLNETSCSLLPLIDKNSEADIIVRGSVYPGVYIEICHVSYIVSHKMSKVRFRLDKKVGRVVADNIAYNDIREVINEYNIDNR